MREQIKLRKWVKVVLTIILVGVIFGCYFKATNGGNFALLYWFMLLPVNYLGIVALWEV